MIIKTFKDFFSYVCSYFDKNKYSDNVEDIEKIIENISNLSSEGKIEITKRTIISKLYSLEQTVSVLEKDYKHDFDEFMKRIEELREEYEIALKESKKALTFEINPDEDFRKIMKTIKLESEINKFIEVKMRFDIISKNLQCLIKKLNVLYNASIYCKNEEDRVLRQIENAILSQKRIISEFKTYFSTVQDNQKSERIVTLITYSDYIIYKTILRNSNMSYESIIDKLAISNEFKGLDYEAIFKDYVLDEISDLGELLNLLGNNDFAVELHNVVDKLLKKAIYCTDCKEIIYGSIMKELLNLEESIINILNINGINKEKAKVRILLRMNINIDDSEIFTLPKTNAILFLSSLVDENDNAVFLIKFLNSITNDVTYKEIYFLLIIFNLLETVKNSKSKLLDYIDDYIIKYKYSENSILNKKKQVFDIENKEYIFIFGVNEYENKIISDCMQNCNLDYYIKDNKLYINLFYFKDLKNVIKNLQENAKKQ